MSLAQALESSAGTAQGSSDTDSSQNDSNQNDSNQNDSSSQNASSQNDSQSSEGSSDVSSDWRSSITDPELGKFIKNFNTPEDMAKSALQFRKKLSSAISVPGSNASEEDIKEFRSKMGVPDSPEGYEYSMPDLPDSIEAEQLTPTIKKITESLHGVGATPDVLKAALDSAIGLISESHEQAQKEWAKSIEEGQNSLKSEWGSDYDTNMTYAERAFHQFSDPEFIDLLKDAKVGGVELINHPSMSKIFASIGRKMGEGGLQYVATKEDSASFEQNQEELTRKAQVALDKGDRMAADRFFKERDEKSRAFYGSE